MSIPAQPASGKMSPEEAVVRLQHRAESIKHEVHKVIIGQEQMLEEMLICLFARGHCLTIGVPGLAKTLAVATLARALHLKFSRIQFTPDLMPSDITGTEIIEEDPASGKRTFRFVRGPIFANIVLADEINRTPPKTQAALLQAMQEYQVTAGGNTHDLDQPFFVMATQNPIEQEGTYPLPEAQLDRFMLSINIGYPSREEEQQIVKTTTQASHSDVQPVLRGRDLLWIRSPVREVPASDHMIDYAVEPGPGHSAERSERTSIYQGLARLGSGTVAPPSTWCWGPRLAQFCTDDSRSVPRTCGPWYVLFCAIAFSPTSMPMPKESIPIKSSTNW